MDSRDNGLPLSYWSIHTAQLPKTVGWMLAYNFDGDNSLTRYEMIQAWLVKTAEWKTGKSFAPDSLSAQAQIGGLDLAQIPLTVMKGINISVEDERGIRGVIDEIAGGGISAYEQTAAQQAVSSTLSSVN